MASRSSHARQSAPPSLPAASDLEAILRPHLTGPAPAELFLHLAIYLQVLYMWNARMNVTAVRDPDELVRLHLAECLMAAESLRSGAVTVLDYGSGAGLPGIPAAALLPEVHFTLAESQGKKAAFLREAIRQMQLKNAGVWAARVEDMPASQRYDAVMLRAVDRMEPALRQAACRMKPGGQCIVLTSEAQQAEIRQILPGLTWTTRAVPQSRQRIILLGVALR